MTTEWVQWEEERGVCIPLVEALPDSSLGAVRTPFPAPPLRAARQRPQVERSGDETPGGLLRGCSPS